MFFQIDPTDCVLGHPPLIMYCTFRCFVNHIALFFGFITCGFQSCEEDRFSSIFDVLSTYKKSRLYNRIHDEKRRYDTNILCITVELLQWFNNSGSINLLLSDLGWHWQTRDCRSSLRNAEIWFCRFFCVYNPAIENLRNRASSRSKSRRSTSNREHQ